MITYSVGEIAEAQACICKGLPLSKKDRLIINYCVEKMFHLLLDDAKRAVK